MVQGLEPVQGRADRAGGLVRDAAMERERQLCTRLRLRKDVLGLWMGTGGEGAKFWMSVLVDLKNRGVGEVFFLVCDGLKGLPDVVTNVWPQTA